MARRNEMRVEIKFKRKLLFSTRYTGPFVAVYNDGCFSVNIFQCWYFRQANTNVETHNGICKNNWGWKIYIKLKPLKTTRYFTRWCQDRYEGKKKEKARKNYMDMNCTQCSLIDRNAFSILEWWNHVVWAILQQHGIGSDLSFTDGRFAENTMLIAGLREETQGSLVLEAAWLNRTTLVQQDSM